MNCEECKINTPACYNICTNEDLKNKCKELFGMSCMFDVMNCEWERRIKERLDNMVTLDEFDNN